MKVAKISPGLALVGLGAAGVAFVVWRVGRAVGAVGEDAAELVQTVKTNVYGESSADHLDTLGQWGSPHYGPFDYLPPPFGTGELIFDRLLIRRAERQAQANLTGDASQVQAALVAEFGTDWQERSRVDPVARSLMRQHLVDIGLRSPDILTKG